jgi:hypothetical protein
VSSPAPQLPLFQERPALDAAAEFDTLFWPTYPLKLGKAAARVAYLKARKSPNWPGIERVLASLEAQKASPRWQAGVIPMAKTWLHQERWEDDAAALTWNGGSGGKRFINGRWVGPPDYYDRNEKWLWWDNFWNDEGRGE